MPRTEQLETSRGWYCYHCGQADGGEVVRLEGEVGDYYDRKHVPAKREHTVTEGRPYRYLCMTCLFDLVVIKRELHVTDGWTDMTPEYEWREAGRWICTNHQTDDFRAAHFTQLENEPFYCEECLFEGVVTRYLTVSINHDAAAAASGPTAKVDEKTGAIEVEGVQFRW